jgi:hypothetical protein
MRVYICITILRIIRGNPKGFCTIIIHKDDKIDINIIEEELYIQRDQFSHEYHDTI